MIETCKVVAFANASDPEHRGIIDAAANAAGWDSVISPNTKLLAHELIDPDQATVLVLGLSAHNMKRIGALQPLLDISDVPRAIISSARGADRLVRPNYSDIQIASNTDTAHKQLAGWLKGILEIQTADQCIRQG